MESLLQELYEADNEIFKSNNNQKEYSSSFIKSSNNKALKKNNSFNSSLHQKWKRLQKKAVFAWPLDKSKCWISSLFGRRKKADGSWGFHYGIDMAAHRGTPVYAADSGTIIEAGFARGYGKTIVIAHNRKFKTRYAHLDKIMVSLGDKVKIGQTMGKVGDTGSVRKKGRDASHLHFEVYVYGTKENPFHFLV